jgi:serine/threonine protein kinase
MLVLRLLLCGVVVIGVAVRCLPEEAGVKRRVFVDGMLQDIKLERNFWKSQQLLTKIAQILLEEYGGYSVAVSNVPMVTPNLTSACSRLGVVSNGAAPEMHANVEVWPMAVAPSTCANTQDLGLSGVTNCSLGACDFAHKYVWTGLKHVAPIAHEILQELHCEDMEDMHFLAGSEELVACDWVTKNREKWIGWMPDASEYACNEHHYDYHVHDCAGPNRQVTFSWKYPLATDPSKADDCVGGSLPSSTHVHCDYVDKDDNSVRILRAFLIVCCLLCFAALVVIVCTRHHAMFARSQPWLLLAMVFGCLLILIPGFVEEGRWTTFKCSAHNLFRGMGSTIIIACHIVKTRHYIVMANGKRMLGKLRHDNDPKGKRRVTKRNTEFRRNSSMDRLSVHNMIRGVEETRKISAAKGRAAKAQAGRQAGGGGTSVQNARGTVGQTSQEFNTAPESSPKTPSRVSFTKRISGAGKAPAVQARRGSLLSRIGAHLPAVVTSGGRIVDDSEHQVDFALIIAHLIQIACFATIDLGIGLLRYGVSPEKASTILVETSFGDYSSSGCVQSDTTLRSIHWLYKFVLLAWAFLCFWRAEKTGLMLEKQYMHSLYNVLVWATVLLFYYSFGNQYALNDYTVSTLTSILGVVLLLALHLGPKVSVLYFGRANRVNVIARSYIIPRAELKIDRPIGGGSFSDVLKGKYKQTQVAIKRLRGEISAESMKSFGKEVIMMAELHHPNVVMMMGIVPGEATVHRLKPPLLVMEYLGRGSLYRVLHLSANKTLDWTMVLKILIDTACGMSYLHAHKPPLVHADLKSPNILVDINWRCKIADLGLAKLKEDSKLASTKTNSQNSAMGSMLWCAPEIFASKRISTKSDVYAFGIVMFECIFQAIPFTEISPMAVPLRVVESVRPAIPKEPINNQDLLGPSFNQLKALMEACWHQQPDHRPPFEHVMAQLEWMAEEYTGQDNWESAVVFPVGDERMSSTESSMMASISSAVRQGYNMVETDLQLGWLIGEGNYGAVYEAMYLGTKVAVKQLYVEAIGQKVIADFHKEVELMKSCDHNNLVALLGMVEAPPRLLLVTELLEKGSFWDMYHNAQVSKSLFKKPADLITFAVRIAQDVAQGMKHLHEKAIIHRDLKSQNIWISVDYTAKVGDFGMSRLSSNHTMTMVGSPLWCAPEILMSKNYSFSADVYSYSIILFELFHWVEPYANMSVMEIMVAVTEHHERPEILDIVPEDICTIICDCWQPDAEHRPTFAALVTRIHEIIAARPEFWTDPTPPTTGGDSESRAAVAPTQKAG